MILGLQIINTWAAKTDDRLELDTYAIQLEKDVSASRDLLSKMVGEALVEWTVYNVRREEESYITDERRDECLEWVIRRVIENTTQTIQAQVGIGYPANTTDEYINSIKNITMIHVLEYVSKQNVKDMTDNDIPNIKMEL